MANTPKDKEKERVNAPTDTGAENLQKQEDAIAQEGTLKKDVSIEDELREKVSSTFEAYPDEEFLYVVLHPNGNATPFLPKALSYANHCAKQQGNKLYKVPRK